MNLSTKSAKFLTPSQSQARITHLECENWSLKDFIALQQRKIQDHTQQNKILQKRLNSFEEYITHLESQNTHDRGKTQGEKKSKLKHPGQTSRLVQTQCHSALTHREPFASDEPPTEPVTEPLTLSNRQTETRSSMKIIPPKPNQCSLSILFKSQNQPEPHNFSTLKNSNYNTDSSTSKHQDLFSSFEKPPKMQPEIQLSKKKSYLEKLKDSCQ